MGTINLAGILKTRYTVLFVACLAYIFWGTIAIVTFYVNAIKAQYNYTQSEVEIIPIAMTMGKLLSPLAAVMYDGLGPVSVTMTGLWFGSGGLFLLWSSTHYIHVCHKFPMIIYIFFFMLGLGGAFMNFSLLTTVTKSFAKGGSGKAVSVLLTFYAISPMIMISIYRKFFTIDPLVDLTVDLSGYMLFLASTTLATGLLCTCLVREHPDVEEETESKLIDNIKESEAKSSDNDTKEQSCWGKCPHLLEWPCILLMLSYALCEAVFYGYDTNIAVISKTSGNYASSDYCFYAFHISIIIARVLTGLASDAFDGIVPRVLYNAISSLMVVICILLFLGFPMFAFSLYLLSVSTGIMGGIIRTMTVTVFVTKMGKENFARNWGVTTFVTSVMIDIWLLAFSAFYEAGREDNSIESFDCRGSSCLFWTNIMTAVWVGVGTVFSFVLAIVKRF